MEKEMKDRLKEARRAHNLTQYALAEKIGVTQQIVALWEKGGVQPRAKILQRLSDILGVTPQWLQFGISSNVATQARPVIVFEDHDPLPDDEVEVPQYNIKLSAGTGKLMWEIDNAGKPNRFRRDWCEKRRINAINLVTLLVEGDSMSPTIPDGASVTIDRSVTTPKNGRIHAIDYMGEFFIKRLFKMPDGSILIQSDNPDRTKYPDMEISGENTDDILHIMGLVVSMQTDIF